MPQALTAFPQQLLSPLNLQPATGVKGLQGGRRAPLNHVLFHHNPRGCTREMFNMNIDNQDEPCTSPLDVSAPFAIIENCFSVQQIQFESDDYTVMSVISHDWTIIKAIQSKANAASLFFKVPLKENLRAVWWLSSIHSASFSELTLPVCSAVLRLGLWSSMAPSASICCAAGHHNTIHFQASHHLIKLTCPSAQHKAFLSEYKKKTQCTPLLFHRSLAHFEAQWFAWICFTPPSRGGFSLSITSLLSAGEELHSQGISHSLWLAAHCRTRRRVLDSNHKHCLQAWLKKKKKGSKYNIFICIITVISNVSLHPIINIHMRFYDTAGSNTKLLISV